MIIARACDNCQEPYDADTRYLNRGQGKFCSRKCSGEHLSRLKTNNKEPNSQCAYCNEPLHITAKRTRKSKSGLFFCNRDCQNLGFSSPDVLVTSGPRSRSNKTKCSGTDCTRRTHNPFCTECLRKNTINQWLIGDNSVTLNQGKTLRRSHS